MIGPFKKGILLGIGVLMALNLVVGYIVFFLLGSPYRFSMENLLLASTITALLQTGYGYIIALGLGIATWIIHTQAQKNDKHKPLVHLLGGAAIGIISLSTILFLVLGAICAGLAFSGALL